MKYIQQMTTMQKELDDKFFAYAEVLEEDTLEDRIIALEIELGEFANELGFFKYWKQSHKIDREKVLEEYIDCWHFILSIGNTIKFDFKYLINNHIRYYRDIQTQHLYLNLKSTVIDLHSETESTTLLYLIELLLEFANRLEFTDEQIFEAYKLKNKINQYRINGGY